MSFWTLERVGQALRGARAGAAFPGGPFPGGRQALGAVSTDTRAIREGDVFVALRGERFDAHDFLPEAVSRGAAALVVSDLRRASGLGRPVFGVGDTLTALGALGAFRRRAWNGTVIAVAGSNGKTTTKELIRAALEGAYTVHATQGNLNNQVGVPLTLLAVPDAADVAVVEVGTNRPGEVAILREIVAPDVSVVTSIGEEHLEGLGDLEGVLREEAAVFRDVEVAVTPASQPEVGRAARALARQTVEAGLATGDVRPDEWGVDAEGCGWARFGETRLALRVRGEHNLRNAMLAMAVARACGVAPDLAAHGIASVAALEMRGVWRALGTLTLINDAYNANPASMREAIALLDALPVDRPRVLVLGSMRELGAHAVALHEEIATRALASGAALVAGIGDFVAPLRAAAGGVANGRVLTAPDVDELWPLLESRLPRNAIVLLKASRGIRLERLVPYLERFVRSGGDG